MIQIGSGPVNQYLLTNEAFYCTDKNSWKWNLLYLNNIPQTSPTGRFCLEQSWYLGADMQCFLLALPVVYLLSRKLSIGLIVSSFVILSSMILKAVQADYYQAQPMAFIHGNWDQRDNSTHKYFSNSYQNTFMRIDVYFLGLLFGVLIRYLKDGKLRILLNLNIPLQLLGWSICTFLMVGALLGPHSWYEHEFSQSFSSFFQATFRLAWSIGLGWIIFVAEFDYCQPLRWFLSLKIWNFISKLSYGIYLIHIYIYFLYYYQTRQAIYFTHLNLFTIYVAVFSIATLVAFVLHLTIEIPVKLLIDR